MFCVSPPLGSSPLITLVLTLFLQAFFGYILTLKRNGLETATQGSRRGDKRHKDGLKLSEQLATNEVALASKLAKLIC